MVIFISAFLVFSLFEAMLSSEVPGVQGIIYVAVFELFAICKGSSHVVISMSLAVTGSECHLDCILGSILGAENFSDH